MSGPDAGIPKASAKSAALRLPYVGGQAVLEGVMMRAPGSFAVAVRRSDGRLHIRERPMQDGARGVSRWPLVRGVASLVESLRLGSEALRFSAEKMEEDMVRAGVAGSTRGLGVLYALGLFVLAAGEDGGGPAGAPPQRRSGTGQWIMLAAAIAFFVALPQAAAAGIDRVLHLGLAVQSPGFQGMTGALKLVIVVGYLVAIRSVPDIRRVFQYHGAEHKTISTYEAGEDLTVANARPKTTLHPRCGTTFLVMVALVSIIVFSAVGAALPRIQTGSRLADNIVFFCEKLPFLPVLAGITFELQRFFARYCSTGPLRALLWPGFLVQKITTAEPDDAQLEVALASLRAVLLRARDSTAPSAGDEDVLFDNYEALVAAPGLRSPPRAAA